MPASPGSTRTVALAAAAALAAALRAATAAAGDLAIEGQVAHPQHLSAAALQAMPATSVEVSFHSGHGEERGRYVGVLLWTLVERAGLADVVGNRPDLHHTLTIFGGDGYRVALSFGEIDPDFAAKPVIIAYARDGHPLDAREGLRLIVPGDRHGGRDVRNVVRIEVE